MKRTFHKGQILTLQIQDMAFGGKGIARLTEKGHCGLRSEPSQAKPSRPRSLKCKSKHAECRLLKVLEKADFELELQHKPSLGRPMPRCRSSANTNGRPQLHWTQRKIGGMENLTTFQV